jgi:hypothetical protein
VHQQIGVVPLLALLAITIGVKDSAPLLADGGRPPVILSLPASTTVNPGETFTLPISLDMEADSHAISTVTLVLAFDPDMLKVTDFSPADVLPEVIEASVGTDTAGLTASSGTDPDAAIKSSTTVATITFQVDGSGGLSTPVSFTRAEAYSLSAWDEASENVVGSTTDASITISGQAESATLDPVEGPPGTEVTATGNGWSAGHEVSVQWEDGTELATTTVDDNGNFTVSFTVPDDAAEGEYTVDFVGIPPEGEAYSIPATFFVTIPPPPSSGPAGSRLTFGCNDERSCAMHSRPIQENTRIPTIQYYMYLTSITQRSLYLADKGHEDNNLKPGQEPILMSKRQGAFTGAFQKAEQAKVQLLHLISKLSELIDTLVSVTGGRVNLPAELLMGSLNR